MSERKSEKKEKVKPGMWAWFQRNEKILLTAIIIGIFPTFGFGTVVISALTGELKDDTAAIIDGDAVPMSVYNEYTRRYLLPLQNFVRSMKSHPQWGGFFGRWEGIGNEIVWKRIAVLKEAGQAGIIVPDAELKDYVTDFFEFENKYSYQLYIGAGPDEDSLEYYRTMFFFQGVYNRSEDGKKMTFDAKRYETAVKGMNLSLEEFERTLREDLVIKKLRYYAELPNIIPVNDIYEKFRKEKEEVRIQFLRFDVDRFEPPAEEVKEADLELFYQSNRRKFEDPPKRSFECVFAPTARLEALIDPSEAEMKAHYEANKDKFKEPADPKEKEKEQKPGEPPAKPEPKYKPFENEDVRSAIRKELIRKKAGDTLKDFMKELADRLKSVETRIRTENAASREGLIKHLREDIVFSDMADQINRNVSKWKIAQYPAYRVDALQSEGLFSKDEIRERFGAIGVRIADKVFETEILTVKEPLSVSEGYILFRGIEDRGPTAPPLATIRDRVIAERKNQKRIDLARARAEEMRKKMATSGFNAVAAAEGLKISKSRFFEKKAVSVPGDGDNPPLGQASAVISTAFTLRGDEVSPVINEPEFGAVYLIQVVERKTPSKEDMSIDDFGRLRSEDERGSRSGIQDRYGPKWEERHKVEDLLRNRATHASGSR